MGIKKDLETIKNEFKSDEKIFENAFRIEHFLKKNKILLIGVIVVIIAGIAYWKVSDILEEKRAQRASGYFAQLQVEPNNQALLDHLKENSKELYELFLLSQAMKNGNEKELNKLMQSKSPLVAQIARYQNASLQKDRKMLSEVNLETLKELAVIQQAYLLKQENKNKEAGEILQSIPETSALKEVAKTLLHYQGKE